MTVVFIDIFHNGADTEMKGEMSYVITGEIYEFDLILTSYNEKFRVVTNGDMYC